MPRNIPKTLVIVPEYDLNIVLEDNNIYKWIINDEELVYSKKYKEDHSGLSKVFHTDLTDKLVCDYACEFKVSKGNIIFNDKALDIHYILCY